MYPKRMFDPQAGATSAVFFAFLAMRGIISGDEPNRPDSYEAAIVLAVTFFIVGGFTAPFIARLRAGLKSRLGW